MDEKVLIIHNTLWSHYKAVVFSELYQILKSKGIRLLVVQQAITEKMRKNMGEIDLSCHQYPYKLLERANLDSVPMLRRIYKLLKEVISAKGTIVVIPGYSDMAYWFVLAVAKMKKIRTIISFDSTESDKQRQWYRELLKKYFVSHFDMAFCYGVKSRAYLAKLGMDPDAIVVRRQATANEEITRIYLEARRHRYRAIRERSLKDRNFIYVGRLSKEKNVDTLLKAFAALKSTQPEAAGWGLLLVGDGPEKDRLQKNIDRERIADVKMIGGVSWKEVPKYYALSDVMVLPSYSEPWGLVANEAMACGLPVVISNRCGAADDIVVDGDNGFVINPYSMEDLRDRMTTLVLNSEERMRMGNRSSQIISLYTPKLAAAQMAYGIEFLMRKV